MKLVIESVLNGWVISYKDDDNQTQKMAYSYGFQVGDYCKEGVSDVKAFQSVLYDINEMLGPHTGRYSEERIHINVEPGDKYEDSMLDGMRPEGQ